MQSVEGTGGGYVHAGPGEGWKRVHVGHWSSGESLERTLEGGEGLVELRYLLLGRDPGRKLVHSAEREGGSDSRRPVGTKGRSCVCIYVPIVGEHLSICD